jgi:hypothetical protein
MQTPQCPWSRSNGGGQVQQPRAPLFGMIFFSLHITSSGGQTLNEKYDVEAKK